VVHGLASAYTDDDAEVELPSLADTIRLADIYDKVDFAEGVRA
jgi:hypothetical protein